MAIQRTTRPTVEVLRVIRDADAALWGLRIVELTGRPTGTVYPILARLAEAGWLDCVPDDGDHAGAPRVLYVLTEAGRAATLQAEQKLAATPARASRARQN